MAKKQIKLTEKDLKNIIRESVTRFLNENMDELSPEFLIHASRKANADKKNHPGRSKGSPDIAMRAKRDRQSSAFGDRAAELINQELGDDRFHVSGDRSARRMKYTNDSGFAHIPYDTEDLGSVKFYRDDYQEGDEPTTLSDLPASEYGDMEAMFNKFKAHHDRAAELDDEYLEEMVYNIVKKVVKESKKK